MKNLVWLFLIGINAGFIQPATAQNIAQINGKRIFFPFFRLHNAPKMLMPLAPQKTQITADLDGIRAIVKVSQTYQNKTSEALNLACVIPADLDKFTATVGKEFTLNKPQIPKNAYQEAQQPLFMPEVKAGATIEMEWEYQVICEKDQETSMFRLPSFQPSIEGANVHYDLKIIFHTDLPIQEVTSEEHLIEVKYPTTNTAEVVFANSETQAGERPFLLRYKFYGADVKITPKKPEDGVMRGDKPKEEYTATVAGKEEDSVSETIYQIEQLYEVKEGEYLEKIASKYNVTVADIKHWNHLKEHAHLKKGQQLKLTVPCMRIIHKVAEDEYPYIIAQLYGVSTNEVLDWNKLKDTDRLSIGQEIYIYKPK